MKHTWHMWSQALNESYCDYIVGKAMKHPPIEGAVGLEREMDTQIRISTLRWLDLVNSDKDIADQLMWFFRRANSLAFGLDIDEIPEIQFTEYNGAASGKYDWHQDVNWDNDAPFDRKLSIVIQLSHPHDYEGGGFEFRDFGSPGDNFRLRGSVLVFPSFFYHRVLPVTSGVRHSLVSWVIGPKFR